jgi:hypothetical protein
VDFKEADINFPPTYKFDLRSTDDTYAKHRTPSYTVRTIDFRIRDNDSEYFSAPFNSRVNNKFKDVAFKS